MRKGAQIALFLSMTLISGYSADSSSIQVVSAASYQPLVSPDSLATVFGAGLAPTIAAGELTSAGELPTKISGVAVLINNTPTGLVYISPTQINFWIPAGVAVGAATVQVVSDSQGTLGSVTVTVAETAPAIFTLDCLRVTRGAVLNGVTYSLEPFAVTTQSNPGSDKRTRLSLFATGVRGAVPGSVSVIATNSAGQQFPLTVEYSGPAPGFFGLDQINIVLSSALDGAGFVNLQVLVNNQTSNFVDITIATSLQLAAFTDAFDVNTVAGGGLSGYSSVPGPAMQAALSNPLGVAIDQSGRLYIADTANNAVRIVSLDGTISTVAGTGVSGFSGDGGPASNAQLNHPEGVAVSPAGDIYVADTGNNRIRRLSPDGTISTFAGNGQAGNAGDFGPATAANLSAPGSVAVDSFLNVLIADTGNNRVRKVAADGLIVPFAGTGTASFSGDGGPAVQASLNAPASVVAGTNQTVYVADAGNYRIRQIQDGIISTFIGSGTQGSQTQPCAALSAELDSPMSLAVDQFGRVFLSDTSSGRLDMLGTDCALYPIAGTGMLGYSGDGGQALSAQFNSPNGVATTLFGEAYVADSGNNRIRKLTPQSIDAACAEESASLGFAPQQGVSGQTVVMQIHLPCAAQSDTTISWTSSLPLPNVPNSVTIPAGQTQIAVPILLPAVDQPTVVTITIGAGPSASFTILPPSIDSNGNPMVTVSVSPDSVTGGALATGSVVLGAAAPAGGAVVNLSASNNAAQVAQQITIPAGQVAAQFEILTVPVAATEQVVVTGVAGNAMGQATLTVLPGGAQSVSSLAFNPNPATAGGTALGTAVLGSAAGPQGQTISLTSNSPAVSVPATISIPAGATSATFPILIGASAPPSVQITAAGPNTITSTLSILPDPAGNGGTISQLILQPSSVTGGNPVNGHIYLAQPAGSGGVVVGLSSSSNAVTLPSTLTVPSGQSDAIFTVNTSSVSQATTAMISASAANTVDASFSIQPSDGAGPGIGTITSLSLSPSTVTTGQGATGTVHLNVPAGSGGVFVTFSSNNGAATVPASITIPQGQTSGTFSVSTSSVSTPTQAVITATSANSASATLTVNPLSAGTGTLAGVSLNPSTVTAGQSSTGTVTLTTAAGAGGVQVNLSSNNAAATVPASIVILQGQTSGTFSVSTSSVSAPTSVLITANSANSALASLTVNPSSAGTAALSGVSVTPTTVSAGQGATGTVTLAAPAGAGGVGVNLSSNNSGATVPASIVIPQGQSSGTFNISTSSVSGQISVTITATSANSVSTTLLVSPIGAGTGTVSSVSISPASVTGGQSATGTVILVTPAGPGGAQVNLSSNNVAATVPASITIPQGQTSGTFAVSTSSVPSATTALITATSATSASASLGINPSSAGTATLSGVSVTPSTVTAGQSATGTVTLAAPAGAGGVLVNLLSNNGAATVPASITIPQGQSSGTFNVSTSSVPSATTAQITATSANSASASLTINPGSPSTAQLSGLTVNPTIVTAGQNATGTVTLAAPAGAGGLLVNLASNSAAATVPASITIPQGQSSGSFTVNTSSITLSVLATITANSANSVTANIVINPVAAGTGAISGVSISPLTVTGGQSATGTVTLLSPAVLGGVQVNLSSNSPAATVPASITIAEGQTTGTFSISTTPVSSATTALITATSTNSASASLTINPSGPGQASLSGVTLNPTEVSAGQSSTGTVTLSAAAGAGGVLVNLSSNSGAATVPASITIPQGQSSGTFNVSTSSVTGSVTATITATSANSTTATLVISPIGTGTGAVSEVSVSPASVTGGQGATGTVTLLVPALLGGVQVNLSSNNPAVSVPASITIAFGQTSGTFAVSTSSVSSPTSVLITATSATSASTTFSVDP
ncbi:MAG TPA: hypothetical protein VME17_00835 [Bryobacteraceae bacterium]|nr:hypothetical protein [Bryobacteraceae bacterium]